MQLLGMSPTSEAGSATGSEDGALRALEALVEDARRTCESRDARIASLLFDPPPALPAREPPDRLEGLQQQVLELQAVLQEKEASVQALRLRATFTQPEEARLESRRLLQESVRLQLELKAKRAQHASSSAKDADLQRLERLRGMHSALQEEQAARRQRRGQEEERATFCWDALQRCAGQLTQGIEQLEQVRRAGRSSGAPLPSHTAALHSLPSPPAQPARLLPPRPPTPTRPPAHPPTHRASVAGSQEAGAALGAHEAQRVSEGQQARAALKERQAAVAELEREWADVVGKVADERARIASSRSEEMQRKEAMGREIAEHQLAASSLRHESGALKQRLARLQSSLDKVEKETREVERRMQQRAGSAAGEAAAAAETAAAAEAAETAAAAEAAEAAAAAETAAAAEAAAPAAAPAAAASSEQQQKPRAATARARFKDVSAMTDNEKYYYYMERNQGRLDLDRADLGVGQPRGSTPPVRATAR